MKIWIDGDACPNAIKTILFRAAMRTETHLIIVSNHVVSTPSSPFIKRCVVNAGFDVADDYIVENLQANDLVITADIPLAAQVVQKQALALNPRGELYTSNNIQQRLGIRNHMEQLRGSGVNIGGPSTFTAKEKMAFANALDKILANSKSPHPPRG